MAQILLEQTTSLGSAATNSGMLVPFGLLPGTAASSPRSSWWLPGAAPEGLSVACIAFTRRAYSPGDKDGELVRQAALCGVRNGAVFGSFHGAQYGNATPTC